MSKKQAISVSQLAIYNPQRISDEVMMQVFIARKKVFKLLMRKIRQEKPNSIPQHHLVIALRGMGKSTLLKRMEVELRQTPYKENFIPLLYPEEQYNLSNLAEFWLNSLDALADTLEIEKENTIYKEIDQQIQQLNAISDDTILAKKAHQYFLAIADKLGRRPILLVDNLNLIFNRLSKAEQHTLRAWLMQNKAPILMGASAVSIEDTHNYGMPFYDAFQQHYLQKLTFEESVEILKELAALTHSEAILPSIHQEIGRLKTIHHLTGGNPRTSVMLFRLISKGFSKELNDDLEALLDEITPLYKARFEALSDSQQKIVDAIALHWDPINLGDLRSATRLENNQISPQLKRLREVGWIESLDAYQAKGKAYQISERFFNIWFLMRRSSRRQKRELLCLSKFLETFYGERLAGIAEGRLVLEAATANHVAFNLAMVEVLKNEELKSKLKEKSYEDLERLAETNPSILEQFKSDDYKKYQLNKLVDSYGQSLQEKEYKNAENILTKLITATKLAILSNDLGNLYQEHLKQFDKAEIAYLNAIKVDEKYAHPWNGLGNLYQDHLKQFDKAENAYLNAIKVDEKYAHPWNGLGNLYQDHLKQFDKAENAYLNAIKVDEKFAHPWNGLGNLYTAHLKQFDKAEIAYLNAIKVDEKFAYPWNGLGNLYTAHLKQFDKAEIAYLNAIKVDEKFAHPWNGLGNLYTTHLKQFDKAEIAYLNAIKVDEKFAHPWNGLGNLYKNHLKQFDKAENAYLKAIKVDEKFAHPWYGLGNLYTAHLKQFDKAENAYLNAIKVDGKFVHPWNGLGNLYQNHLKQFDKAEIAYLNAIKVDEKYAHHWNGLGNLYRTHLKQFDKAENAYLNAIKVDEKYALPWNGLGNLYQDYLKQYKKSKQAYLKALALNNDLVIPKYNLVFLYRDKLHQLEKAKNLFKEIELDKSVEDSHHLNITLFDLYEKNEGIAKVGLLKALKIIGEELPPNTKDDWIRFAAITTKLGYNQWLQNTLKEKGYNIILAPYFIAIKALNEKDEEGYLNSKAVEVREPAKKIIEMIRRYMD